MRNRSNLKKYKLLAPIYDLIMSNNLDKFLLKSQSVTGVRKALNIVTAFIGTDINRRFEEITKGLSVKVLYDEPSVFRGSYRTIVLEKLYPNQ